ncbi:UDP-N-acetylglucosamine 2-epimerase [Candidatus Woesearchaeota archaeon]|nr:UDP-N-acetylglucosamine 2-epimerase [Candidatus Woesearchaeota archaeon]
MDNLVILDSEKRKIPSSGAFLARVYEYIEEKYLQINYNYFLIPKLKKYTSKGNTKIVCMDKEMEALLLRNKVPFTPAANYVRKGEYRTFRDKAMKFTGDLPSIVPEIDALFKGVSLWKINKLIIYESILLPLISRIEMTYKIINREQPKNLLVFNSLSMNGVIQKEFGSDVGLVNEASILSSINKFFIGLLTPFILKIMSFSFMSSIKNAKNKPEPKRARKIVFFDKERAFRLSLPFLGKVRGDITVLQYEIYKDRYNQKSKGGNKKEEEFFFDSLWDYADVNSKEELISFKKEMIKKLRKIKKNKVFRKKLTYKNIRLFHSMEDILDYLFIVSYLKDVFTYLCLDNFFILRKPKLIIHMGEGPKEHKIIVDFSKKYGIKTLFVMHGSFGIDYSVYSLKSDKIVVYGKHYKDLLIRMKTEGNKIVVEGNPSWDYLAKKRFDKEKIMSELKIPGGKKIVLLATVHIPIDLRDGLAYSAVRSMARLKDYFLIIKLHPEEKPDFYRELLRKYNLEAKIISDINLLHPLISISDLVIISNSTVGLEALILDKPLIDVNLTPNDYYQDYVVSKVALGVRDEKYMLPAIRSVLEDKKVRAGLKRNRKRYLYEHAYKMDGRASERVLKVIRTMA